MGIKDRLLTKSNKGVKIVSTRRENMLEHIEKMYDKEEAAAIKSYYTNKDQSSRDVLIMKNLKVVEAVIKNRFRVDPQYEGDVFADGVLIMENVLDGFTLEHGQRFHIYLYRRVYNGLKNIYPQYNIFKPSNVKLEEEIVVEESDQGLWENQMLNEMYLQQTTQGIKKIISQMPKRDQEIIEYKFGLKGESSKSYGEIAKMYNISRERVREICEKVLHILKRKLASCEKDVSCIGL